MNVKKIKRKCGVRGCKNTESFIISKTREMGGSVIMCRKCLAEASKAIDGYSEPEKVKKAPRPLFPHSKSEVTLSSATQVEPEPNEVIDADAEDVDIKVAEDTVTQEGPIKASTTKKITNKKK